MKAPVMAGVARAAATPAWRPVALPLCLGLLALGAAFYREAAAAVQTWEASTAYNHCFLVVPIALYLLWDRRSDLLGIQARPLPAAALLAVPLGLGWLAAERLGIMEGRQLAAVALLEVLMFAVLGRRLWGAMAGPLLYLFFLVPFGEFLTPKLQDVTTFFIRNGLEWAGIPAFIDGYIIEIPEGTFFVAEACAGLRFLIASIAFGCLYALIMYRSMVRRAVFIAVSVVVPIIANGFRGFGIVYLGHVLGSAEAAAADHVIYGWLFFSSVILVLIAVGLPFRQDDMPTRSPDGPGPAGPVPSVARTVVPALAVGAVAAAGPLLVAALTLATVADGVVPPSVVPGAGCLEVAGAASDPAAPRVRSQRVVCGQYAMDLTWEAFAPRVTAAPVMAERRRLTARAQTEGLQESWLEDVGGPNGGGPNDGGPNGGWRIMRSNDPAFVTAVSIWVGGAPVRPGLGMRVRLALTSLLGSTHAPMVMTVTPVADWDRLTGSARRQAEASLPAFLLAYPGLSEAVGAASAVR